MVLRTIRDTDVCTEGAKEKQNNNNKFTIQCSGEENMEVNYQ